MFEIARAEKPIIVWINDLEYYGTEISEGNSVSLKAEKEEFLKQLKSNEM